MPFVVIFHLCHLGFLAGQQASESAFVKVSLTVSVGFPSRKATAEQDL